MSDTLPGKTRILVVDDSKVMRKSAAKMLGDEFDVVTADDGADGWRVLESDPTVQVVFTDLSMPRMDGYAFLKKVRTAEDAGINGMPVIVVTGAENDDAAREKALDMGATDFITKPFNSTDLLARARAHANYQRMARKLQAQSTLDPLTGLMNRNGFMERLKQDISFARRHQQPLTLVRLEIDDFKKVFLQHGKDAADGLVVQVARVVRECIRKEDSAGRIGLSNFALSLPTGQHEGSKGLAARILAQVREQVSAAGGKSLQVTLSGGVLTPEFHPGLTAVSAMEECQRVLEAATKAGGNRVLGDSDLRTAKAKAAEALLPSRAVPPAKPEVLPGQVRIDDLLSRLEAGEGDAVRDQLPQALKRLLPLFRHLAPKQRAQLVQYLQKLDDAGAS